MIRLAPAQTARYLANAHGIERAINAAIDYRAHLHMPDTHGHKFWSDVIYNLKTLRKKLHDATKEGHKQGNVEELVLGS
jgi:hypothetical protein